ncbi:hypothetical protein [Prevotella sp. AM34-19LB]|jgi:hypothetical protein|uniref:hypothetical protein n=1 Tax=Prevotella sp. AM34-19LB TaxID=2292364 RepID=UPI00131487A6|nr:hypothetical protein [Prevotella sp. AM34-19LB]
MERNKELTLHRVIDLIKKTNERIDLTNDRLEIAERDNNRLFLLVVIEAVAIAIAILA